MGNIFKLKLKMINDPDPLKIIGKRFKVKQHGGGMYRFFTFIKYKEGKYFTDDINGDEGGGYTKEMINLHFSKSHNWEWAA